MFLRAIDEAGSVCGRMEWGVWHEEQLGALALEGIQLGFVLGGLLRLGRRFEKILAGLDREERVEDQREAEAGHAAIARLEEDWSTRIGAWKRRVATSTLASQSSQRDSSGPR